jgi:hypothetical protein
MRHVPLPLGLLAALCLVPGATRGQDKPPIELPKDPATPVITLDFLGGGILRKNQEPQLLIRADGTVIVGDPYGIGKRVEAKITPAELQALLRYTIREQHFFDFDADKVKAAVADIQRKKGIGIAIGGGSTTVIAIKTAAKEHAARYYALGTVAEQYKEVKALGQLLAVERRLQRTMYQATAGGAADLDKLRKLANERLKKEYPDAAPLTADDLMFARWAKDTLEVRFFRRGAQAGTFVSAQVSRPAQGEPTVFVKAKVK